MPCHSCNCNPCGCNDDSDSDVKVKKTKKQQQRDSDSDSEQEQQQNNNRDDDDDDDDDDNDDDDNDREHNRQNDDDDDDDNDDDDEPPVPQTAPQASVLSTIVRFYNVNDGKHAAVKPGQAVPFPLATRQSKIIQRLSETEFELKAKGTFAIEFSLGLCCPSQLQLEIAPVFRGNDTQYSTIEASTATSTPVISGEVLIHGSDIIDTKNTTSVIRLVNPSVNTNVIKLLGSPTKSSGGRCNAERIHSITIKQLA